MQPIYLVSQDQQCVIIAYSWETVKALQPNFNPCSKQHYQQIMQETAQSDLHLCIIPESPFDPHAVPDQYHASPV